MKPKRTPEQAIASCARTALRRACSAVRMGRAEAARVWLAQAQAFAHALWEMGAHRASDALNRRRIRIVQAMRAKKSDQAEEPEGHFFSSRYGDW